MPNLKELLAKAKEQEAGKGQKKLTRGARPDLVISKPLIQIKDRSQNVEITQPERRDKGGQNVAITEPKRSQQPGQNVAIEFETQPERRDKGGQNVAITEPKRSQQPGQNVAILSRVQTHDPTLLVGVQRKMFEYLFGLAQQFASLKTPRLTLESISAATGQRETQIHSATKQLRQKGCIVLSARKDGRGGWVEYSVTQNAFDLWIRLENKQNRSQNVEITEPKRSQQPGHKAVHEPSSSSRDLLIKEPTTTQAVDLISRIDLTLVQHLGVTTSVLARCVELYPVLKPEQLEVLVFRFAEFTKDPKNKVQNARGFFISLAEQASKGQVPLDHIETPDDRLMRSFVERQKEAKTRQADTERAAQEFECEAWLETLTPEMKLSLVPETAILKAGTAAYAAMLKSHFTEKVWPVRRMEILEQEAGL
jgi:hypothetical protein